MQVGERFRTRALRWKERFAVVGDVRGLGAMQAIELVSAGQAPNADATKALAQYCLEHGVILVTAGSYGNVVRVLMPLVITDAQMDESLDVMETGLALLSGAETPSIPEHAVVS